MSLVKIARIDLFLSMTQSHNSQSFVSFTYNTGWQIIDIQANSTNYSILSLSFSLSLSFIRIRGNSSPRSRSIDSGRSDRDFESTVAFFVHD